MDNYSRKKNNLKNKVTRESIIGLGEESFQKNYYPELQEKIVSLERVSARNKALMMAIPDILLVSDAQGNITPFSSGEQSKTTGTLLIFRNQHLLKTLQKMAQEVLKSKELRTHFFEMQEEERTCFFEARLHKTELDEVLIIIRDMTKRIELEHRLRRMAETDHMTDLFNRRCFEEAFMELEGQPCTAVGLVLFDIDGLKIINETLGHITGDTVIRAVGQMVKEVFGEVGFIARVGGNEFGVITRNQKVDILEKAIQTFSERLQTYNEKDNLYKVEVSYGYAYHSQGTLNTSLMYQEADNNLYQHKLLKDTSSKSALVRTLMKALEAKDYITEGHADRMSFLAEKLGKAQGFSQNQLDRVRLLAKFHDLGKVGIPDKILQKPAALTTEEWKVMKTHTVIGERIASATPELKEISRLILKHHEKWDGTGYPLQLKGEEIPVECRVLSIVDAFDAMTNERPYRKAMTVKEALDRIKACQGTQFDPEMARIFVEICQDYQLDHS
ncbi:bifunctional diguanylate cyclase/phosphohydrolase [Tindallia californiensis]|uniref:Diguanylate cyclase (GGDEF) domain-containing protein n=1 Tax=Tindallia californiensis TaxID=159292 RepID=A0A1H3Q9N3_9FIRM|nr:diguanylate cyclase [Tindallia californiensis]SDZ09409.1 diguanylate cyclase (GGDEF) domain-containing protein [Tindallia californiensis]